MTTRHARHYAAVKEIAVRKATLYVFLVAGLAALASAQTTDLPPMNYLADSVTKEGDTVHLKGNVRIAACSVVTARARRGAAPTSN